MVYRPYGFVPSDAPVVRVSEPVAGRYRGIAPLPSIGGVARELAVDQVADHRVAIARVPGGPGGERARTLAEALQTCRHASLPPVLDVAAADDGGVVVVEAQSDGPLLSSVADLPFQSALLVAADIADALVVLHRAGFVHGGLAPDAVVLDAAGRAVVCGAGLASLREVAAGEAVGVPADDLRALGGILYRMVTGREPGPAPEPPIALVPSTSPALNGLVMALLSEDALRPPPPAEPVAARLRALAGVTLPSETAVAPMRATPALPPPRAPRRGLSDSALAAVVGGLALIAIVLAAVGAGAGGYLDGTDDAADTVPVFTLPQTDPLPLTVTDIIEEDEIIEDGFLTEDGFLPDEEILPDGEIVPAPDIEEFTVTGENLEEDIITIE